ncbi:hypothetical protein LCGC14_0320920 [marine sediment metagenome]|uniref:phosphoribosylglycinamide formyltransferase 1 n=1 Tax=marine sediment metagenome TaxID=412755 RepID=A0A0F9TJ09_9ZZZZ|nr:phosphoribosylglycinamide formyltransferase [Phycisphaerae bacterium]HDZ43142.1 phosphoribosylglycinamide formyltransferase [Phycisphaerae bacterium]
MATSAIRLGVLISGGGRTLLNICDEIDAGRLDAQVVVVIASRPCKGIERARSRGLDVQVAAYKQMPDTETYSARIVEILDAAGVELALQGGFLSLWHIPRQYEGKVMNIHPALLPTHGGRGMWGHHVHEAVLAAGESESGCTVHFVTNEYDAGPVILQKRVPVLAGDDADALADRVFEAECVAYPEAIRLFAAGRLTIENGCVVIAE